MISIEGGQDLAIGDNSSIFCTGITRRTFIQRYLYNIFSRSQYEWNILNREVAVGRLGWTNLRLLWWGFTANFVLLWHRHVASSQSWENQNIQNLTGHKTHMTNITYAADMTVQQTKKGTNKRENIVKLPKEYDNMYKSFVMFFPMVISFLLLPESSCRADQLWGITITTFPGTLYLSLSVSVFASVCLCLCICLFVSLRLINYGELPSKVFLARDQWPRCLIQSTTSLKTSIFKENKRYIGKLFAAFYNFFSEIFLTRNTGNICFVSTFPFLSRVDGVSLFPPTDRGGIWHLTGEAFEMRKGRQ